MEKLSATKMELVDNMQVVMDRLDLNYTESAHLCPSCGVRCHRTLEMFIGTDVICQSCGHAYDSWNAPTAPLPVFFPVMEAEMARELIFYHWTTMENWLEEIPVELMAHMGCKQAAFDRMEDEFKNRLYGGTDTTGDGYVYAICLNEDACFEEYLRYDEEDVSVDHRALRYSVEREVGQQAVEFYTNVVEAPGSISVCAPKGMFTVLDRQPARDFFGAEAMASAKARVND